MPVPDGGACPAECTGGCEGGTCVFLCNQQKLCQGTINCPPGLPCDVRCTVATSCQNTIIQCPPDYDCTVECGPVGAGAQAACQGIRVNCSDTGTCELSCYGGSQQECESGRVYCGQNSCSANCPGLQNFPQVNCGQSCSCTPC
jgi:hypothetical protein